MLLTGGISLLSPYIPFNFQEGFCLLLGPGVDAHQIHVDCAALLGVYKHSSRFFEEVLTQNAGPMDVDTGLSGWQRCGHLPPGLPSLSKSAQNCCAHKNEVMKTSNPVCQFKKKITRGK